MWKDMREREMTLIRNLYACEITLEIRVALRGCEIEPAFTMLQELHRQVHCRGKHAGRFSLSYPLREEQSGWVLLMAIFTVACYHIYMQDRWSKPYFKSQSQFWEWAEKLICNTHMDALGQGWEVRTNLRLAELHLRRRSYSPGGPAGMISGSRKRGVRSPLKTTKLFATSMVAVRNGWRAQQP